eukprot:679981-Pleurochrysis_carterae.AAC.2
MHSMRPCEARDAKLATGTTAAIADAETPATGVWCDGVGGGRLGGRTPGTADPSPAPRRSCRARPITVVSWPVGEE